MNEITKKLLKKLGYSDETIAAMEDAEKSKGLKVEELYSETVNSFRKVFENDSSFIDPIHESVRGELLSSKERKIMKLFPEITKEMIDELPKKNRFDSLLEKLKEMSDEKASGGKGPDDKDKEIEKLNTEITTFKNRIKEFEEVEIPKVKAESQQFISEFKTKDVLKRALAKNKLIVSSDVALPSVEMELKKNYDLKLDESKDSIALYQKGKELKAFRDNKEITFEDEVSSIVERLELKAKSNADGNGTGGKKIPDGDGNGRKVIGNNAEKASEHAKVMFPAKNKE